MTPLEWDVQHPEKHGVYHSMYEKMYCVFQRHNSKKLSVVSMLQKKCMISASSHSCYAIMLFPCRDHPTQQNVMCDEPMSP